MRVYSVNQMPPQPVGEPPEFTGYKFIVKKLWREGKLPTVVKGIYGDVLTQENLSAEHIIPKSKPHSRTTSDNLALSTMENNRKRGNKPLCWYFSEDNFKTYCDQFKDVVVGSFNGNDYVQALTKTVRKVLRYEVKNHLDING